MRVHATVKDFLIAWNQLTDADHLRLRRAARRYMGGTLYRDPQELVADAINTAYCAAAGHGGRRWPLEVRFMAYLINTIRGIASDERRAQARHPTITGCLGPEDQLPESAAIDPSDSRTVSAEDWCSQAQERHHRDQQGEDWLDKARHHFQNDADVLWIIRGIVEGLSASEIIRLSGMTETRHESAHRRWRRYRGRN
jgi:DNA-directed RNA polymerase specialized sigma24 family protein